MKITTLNINKNSLYATATRRRLSVQEYIDGVLAGDRSTLGRAITVVESRNPEHHYISEEIILRLLPYSGQAHRIGITGVPGVGKSTFIESLGSRLTYSGYKVAVLAVDPSSTRTGGSVLGDKTRMEKLSIDSRAFIRPSPSAGTLGGVARKTRETIIVCEAAGYDVILIETVGVGQSETVVAEMVDFFLVLMLPGAGDELQGIKKGVLEIADMIAVNKADGDNEALAGLAARDYYNALRIITPKNITWKPPVITCAALSGKGLDILWEKVSEHRHLLTTSGELSDKRKKQQIRWMWSLLDDQLIWALRHHPMVKSILPGLEQDIIGNRLSPTLAVKHILQVFLEGKQWTEDIGSFSI